MRSFAFSLLAFAFAFTARAQQLRLLLARALLCLGAALFMVQVHAAFPAPGTIIQAQASALYSDGSSTSQSTSYSNLVIAEIKPVEQLTLTKNNDLQRPALSTAAFPHVLTNTGNVASTYSVSVDRNACPATSQSFNAYSVYLDANGNGIAESFERKLPLDAAAVLKLAPGEFANLLMLGTVPFLADGSQVCARLVVKTDTDSENVRLAANQDTVTLTSNAVVTITKAANYSGDLVAGSSTIRYTFTVQNIGSAAANATAQASDGATYQAIKVDGVPQTLLLVRDVLPPGLEYVPGSLKTLVYGVRRLFRYAGEPAFNYHSADAPNGTAISGNERADAVEIALALPNGLQVNSTINLEFQAKVLRTAPRTVSNQASVHFNDGSGNSTSLSNPSVVKTNTAVIGLAKTAISTIANLNSSGVSDGTATVRFQVLLRNYGSVPLYNVNVVDVLENTVDGLKNYTSSAIPTGAGEYTVVANSLHIVAQNNIGMPGVLASDFTGQAGHASLFSTAPTLPPGAAYTLQFDVRYNLSGLPDTLYNSAQASATLDTLPSSGVAAPQVSTASVNGTNPDAAGDGNPPAHASRTPYSTRLPTLNLVKTLEPATRVQGLTGTYDMVVSLRVTNVGTGDAAVVRLVDSLTCAFPVGTTFKSWSIVSAPKSINGLLTPSTAFTGAESTCNAAAQGSTDPMASFPSQVSLSVLDDSRGLRVGESDTIKFTVRYVLADAVLGTVVTVTNKAWAGVVQSSGASVLQWATSAVDSRQTADPSGVVYNAVTRQPVAGATVTLTRQSCQASAATPLTMAELFGDASIYTFNADGSVSMLTDATGSYAFVFKVPPVNDLCTYGLKVAPPSSSGLVFPSSLIPPVPSKFSSCGAVTDVANAPQGADSTTYHLQVVAGKNTVLNSVCEVVNNNIPLDTVSGNVLTLQKTSSSATAEVGDMLTFTLKASNVSNVALPKLSIRDQLPFGFRYIPGSARVAGSRLSDPTGGIGPDLVFDMPVTSTGPLDKGQSITLTYQVRVAANAPVGTDAVNRAWASTGTGTSVITSNEANARVRLLGGVFANEAYAFGKVFLDCNKNGIQDEVERGIPGVRLFLEDGTGVVTDLEGKWSLYGLRPVTHALRLEASTLPVGAQVALMEPRQSDQADSIFLDLKNGEWHRANFAVQNCESPGLLKAVDDRRDAIIAQPAGEGEVSRASARISADGRVTTPTDVRGLPAAGTIDASGGLKPVTTVSSSLIAMPGSLATADFPPLVSGNDSAIPSALPAAKANLSAGAPDGTRGQHSAPEAALLEDTLSGVDFKLGFLDMADKQVLGSAVSHVRVKGRIGSRLQLSVNGVTVPEDRVGKRARVESQQLEAWEYIAVQFRPGVNLVQVKEVDGFGIVRGTVQMEVSAPGPLAKIELEVASTAKADERTPVPVTVRLLDANGLAVQERTALNLESIATRWNVTDINPLEPGVQSVVQGGSGQFELIPPANPGDGKIRVSAGTIQTEARIIFLPDLRPLTGIGVLEGVLHLRNPGNLPLGAPTAADAFESELRGWSEQTGDSKGAARAAFYFKGAVKGEYLLTTAYDSDKTSASTMFRDIQPDQFYPVYGDSSSKSFDAQSSQRFYVRIDKNRSYLLYGDFNTATSSEVRKLSQVSRANTGLQHVYNSDDLRVSSHYSRDSLKQIIEEIPANGTSGPFLLTNSNGSDLFANSETVQVVVRDRNQPNVILSTVALARFVDYSIEPLSKRLLLTRPVSFLDPNLNPQSIRINYVVDTGGPAFDVAGVDVQLRMSDRLQLGVVTEYDGAPDNQRRIAAATALARLGDKTVLKGEIVATQTDLKGDGQAVGIELRRDDTLLKYNLTVQASDSGFDNPNAGLIAGHTEMRGHLDYKLAEDTHLKAEMVYTRDNGIATASGTSNAVQTQGVSVSVQNKVTTNVTAEVGLRAGQTDTSAATGFDYGSVSVGTSPTTAPTAASGTQRDTLAARARVTVKVPEATNAQVFAEAEQDLYDNNRHIAAIGGHYALNDKARVYGRYELISSLGSEYALTSGVQRNVGMVGVESAYMQGGRIYDEYRIADTIDGRAMQSAMGVRNTFEVTDGFRLNAGVEQVSAMPGATGTANSASTAVTGGFDWLGTGDYKGRLRGSGALELRDGGDSSSTLLSFGLAYKLDADWSLLTRATLNQVSSHTDGSLHWLEREQIGFAYRPVGQDVWNSLFRYEHKADTWGIGTNTTLAPVNSITDILSAHLNYQPRRGDIVSARLASKYNIASASGTRSTYGAHLLYARWTHDLGRDWDVGLQAGLLQGDGGMQQHSFGAELGYQLTQGLWLSGGYNLVGLHDPDLAGADYTDAGFYIRLRFKFDERLFSSQQTAATPAK